MVENIPNGSCICSICKVEKDNSQFCFYQNRFTRDGLRLRVNTNCKTCADILRIEKNKLEGPVKHLRPSPGDPCPCCGKPMKKPEFDHCHTSKVFRGFVCKDCNVGFGKLGDTPYGILRAFKYMFKSITDPVERNRLLDEISQIQSENQTPVIQTIQ